MSPSVRKLPPELQQLAIEEINEDPARISGDLTYLREWLSKQPHIRSRTDDQFLLYFLRGSKFSLERAKQKFDTYHTLKTLTPELYSNLDPLLPELQEVLKLGIMLALPKLEHPAAPRVYLIRDKLTAKHKLNQLNVFRVCIMIQTILMLEDDNLPIAGHIVIEDLTSAPLSYALGLSPTLVKKTMACFQDAHPNRSKGIHFLNATSVFEILSNLFKPLLPEKIRNRVFVHSNIEDLYKHVPRSVLPKEYGGDGGKLEDIVKDWKKKVESYRDWFIEDEQYKTDESKRPGKPKTAESVFGLEGSFRQLALD